MVPYYRSSFLIDPFLPGAALPAEPCGSVRLVLSFSFGSSAGLIMSSDFPRKVLLDVSGFPASVNRNAIATAITNQFASLKVTAVQFVGNVARVSFVDAAGKQLIIRNESIVIGDIPCRVRGGGHALKKFSCIIFHLTQITAC